MSISLYRLYGYLCLSELNAEVCKGETLRVSIYGEDLHTSHLSSPMQYIHPMNSHISLGMATAVRAKPAKWCKEHAHEDLVMIQNYIRRRFTGMGGKYCILFNLGWPRMHIIFHKLVNWSGHIAVYFITNNFCCTVAWDVFIWFFPHDRSFLERCFPWLCWLA